MNCANLWLLVAGDIAPVGGMDAANFALARYLATRPDVELHLVAHRVWPELAATGRVHTHLAWRPFGSHALGAPFMTKLGERWANELGARGAHLVVNGGNCRAGDVSWVHYIHAAHTPVGANGLTRLKDRWWHRRGLVHERQALGRARVVLCNSRRTERDLVERVGVDRSRTRVVYYGTDPQRFSRITVDERRAERVRLGWSDARPVAVFIGALGDRRKGFDTLFEAWRRLCADPVWDGDLAVVGSGGELPAWRTRAAAGRLGDRLHFLGFRTDVAQVLAACDLLVHPARYEAYGLGVHEALCRGLPALVSADAGVAERYPADLSELLLGKPDDVSELVERLRRWRRHRESIREAVAPFADALRQRTWDDMAQEIVELVESGAGRVQGPGSRVQRAGC